MRLVYLRRPACEIVVVLVAVVLATYTAQASAQDQLAPAAAKSGSVPFGPPLPPGAPSTAEAAPRSPATDPLARLNEMTTLVRALTEGTLPAKVEPQSLFEVALTDENAVEVERVRLRALLRTVEQSALPDPPPPPRRRGKPEPVPVPEQVVATRADIETLNAAEWQARLELDRARLAFYSLPAAQREARLSAHAALVASQRAKESDAQRKAREAEEERQRASRERQRALDSAREARSEAERLVAEELARLIGIEQTIAAQEAEFERARTALAARRDSVLGWQRRLRDLKARLPGSPADADAAYAELRRLLRASRAELSDALDDLSSSKTSIPALGADALKEVPAQVSTEQVRERRTAIERSSQQARQAESALRQERASTLLDEVRALNQERLDLLPYLSAAKRTAITGLTAEGFDQARSEAFHLQLILRYHAHVVVNWVGAIRSHGMARIGLWGLAWAAVPWLLVGIGWLWWKRRSPELLALAEKRVLELERLERRTQPSSAHKALQLARALQQPLERLIFFSILVWLLPEGASALLEVQLLTVIVSWSLGGTLVVNAVNAFATLTGGAGASTNDAAAQLRLRSLRLVGRVVVGFGLTLVLSSRLVGPGTVYNWTLTLCWFAAVPVFLVLVRWWRQTVFDRMDRVRRKSPLQSWLLANRTGWKSFFAAMVAAVHLFAFGAYKIATKWLAGFYLTRKAHAYLFKRELDRLNEGKPTHETQPLSRAAMESLAPDRPSKVWVACPADELLETLRERVLKRRGGVVAVVGGLGSGKSSLLRRLASEQPGALKFRCKADQAIEAVLEAHNQLAESAGARDLVAPVIVLDDADTLVKPVLGGLRAFDASLVYARTHSLSTLWVFAIDAVIWPFLHRARDSRPLFDEVFKLESWTDEQIGELLSQRSTEAKIIPTFEDLLDKLPLNADDIDKQEALLAKRAGYFRMVWDYARGNPAIALEVWRASLAAEGSEIGRVRPLQAPSAAQLESLPQSSLFVLRAVLQLSPATVADVAIATRLSEEQVHSAIRFGQTLGYLVEDGAGVRVKWSWLRSVLSLLERRHLLESP